MTIYLCMICECVSECHAYLMISLKRCRESVRKGVFSLARQSLMRQLRLRHSSSRRSRSSSTSASSPNPRATAMSKQVWFSYNKDRLISYLIFLKYLHSSFSLYLLYVLIIFLLHLYYYLQQLHVMQYFDIYCVSLN